VEPVIGEAVPIPATVQQQLLLEKKSTKIAAEVDLLKTFLLSL
jgi:threonine synthase